MSGTNLMAIFGIIVLLLGVITDIVLFVIASKTSSKPVKVIAIILAALIAITLIIVLFGAFIASLLFGF